MCPTSNDVHQSTVSPVFSRVPVQGGFGVVKRDSPLYSLLNGCDLSDFLKRGVALKEDTSRRSLIVEMGKGYKVYCKVYFEKGVRSTLRRLFKGERVDHNHKISCKLRDVGINTPESLGCVYLKASYIERESWHFFELLPECKMLAHWFGREVSDVDDGCSVQSRKDVIRKAVDQIAMLHLSGLFHGDLKLSNLVLWKGEIYLLDLDGVAEITSGESGAKDLSRFVAGMHELGADPEELGVIVDYYASLLQLDRSTVEADVLKNAEKTIERRRKKYGKDFPEELTIRY